MIKRIAFLFLPLILICGGMFSSCQNYESLFAIKPFYPEAQIPGNVLRIKVDELGTRFPIIIRTTAKEIRSETKDPRIDNNTVLWELSANSMIQRAVFHNNPLLVLGELWAISVQLTQYYEKGDGKDAFGPYQSMAIAACKKLEMEAEAVAAESLSPEHFNSVKVRLSEWASKEGALRGKYMLRGSTLPHGSSASFGLKEKSAFQALSNINESLDKIAYSITAGAEKMPEYMRWQTELILAEVYEEIGNLATSVAVSEIIIMLTFAVVMISLLIILIVLVRKFHRAEIEGRQQ